LKPNRTATNRSTPGGGSTLGTAFITGTDQRTPGHGGSLVLVSGAKVITNVAGNFPVFAIQELDFVPPQIEVELDIKPGNAFNPINPRARSAVPVAILGSDTFDVADASTLAFGPAAAPLAHRNGPHPKDANHDDIPDVLAHFLTEESGIASGDTEACVTGELLDGTPFEGCDEITTQTPSGKCGLGFELALVLAPLGWLTARRRRG
jgi:hypothetical protein